MKTPCGCRLCRQGIDFKTLYEALPENLHPILENIQSDLYHTQVDLDYANSVMENKWPSAVEHMKSLGWERIDKNITGGTE